MRAEQRRCSVAGLHTRGTRRRHQARALRRIPSPAERCRARLCHRAQLAVSSDQSRLELRLTTIGPENTIEQMLPLPFLQNDSRHTGLVMSAASQRLAIARRTDRGTLRALLVDP